MVTDSFVGGILNMEATGQFEAPQSESTVSSELSSLLPSSHHWHLFKANHPVPSGPETMNAALSFTSGSTFILPFSQQKPETTASDDSQGQSGISQLNLQTQAAYKSQRFD